MPFPDCTVDQINQIKSNLFYLIFSSRK